MLRVGVLGEPRGWWVPIFTVALGFFLFRFFDVVKVQPARALEDQPGGFGIMADDLVSGLYANLILQVVLRLLPGVAS